METAETHITLKAAPRRSPGAVGSAAFLRSRAAEDVGALEETLQLLAADDDPFSR